MATQSVTSGQQKPPAFRAQTPPPQKTIATNIQRPETPVLDQPVDEFRSLTPELPKGPPNTPVSQKKSISKTMFGSKKSDTSTKTDTKQEDQGRGFLGAVGGMARAVVQGPAYALLSNVITIPAGLIMAVTGVGILPALATWFLGPLAAGAWGAYRGFQGKF
jgi:hypothetical protein